MIEIYSNDLKEEKQKELLAHEGILGPEDANWDTIPVAIFEGIYKDIHTRCLDIFDSLDGDDADDMLAQLRSLRTCDEITEEEYNYIISNWDDLLEEV